MSKKGKRSKAKKGKKRSRVEAVAEPPTLSVAEMQIAAVQRASRPDVLTGYWDGEKFPGGMGPVIELVDDYWVLRARSRYLFETNSYARGIIRRLDTNIVNTGLALEAQPEEELLGRQLNELAPWSEDIENRFHIWSSRPRLCHLTEQLHFGAIQSMALREAYVAGDCLSVLVRDRKTGLPRVRLVAGENVRTPFNDPRVRDRNIVDGVELDKQGRHIAYWVVQPDNKFERLPAWGERSGRRIAWLVYGIERRPDQVRGKPLLSIILQNLKEIDRYRDAVQRKAVTNGQIAAFLEKETTGGASLAAFTGGAQKKGSMQVVDNDGTERNFPIAEGIPGLVIQELNPGEKISAHTNQGTDDRFGDFESAMVQGMSWSLEIPPEILRLSFSSNYSASTAAINEFKIYLNPARTDFASEFDQIIYEEWLIAQALSGDIEHGDEILSAWRDPSAYLALGAWTQADWTGHIKPSTDLLKQVNAFEKMRDNGWMTNAKITRELNGTKYSKNIKQLAVENPELARVRALLDNGGQAGAGGQPQGGENVNAQLVELVTMLEERIDTLEANETRTLELLERRSA